jgi:hypothetical protein
VSALDFKVPNPKAIFAILVRVLSEVFLKKLKITFTMIKPIFECFKGRTLFGSFSLWRVGVGGGIPPKTLET